jgi:hypothetical protein
MSSSKNENKIKYLKSQFILEKEDTPKKNIILKKSKLSTNTLIRTIFKKFNLKYNIMPKRYNKIIMDNIIFNEKSHIVSIFKDFLIIYDNNDFLKRYYTKSEIDIRLPRYFEYYESYSKIFPNYTSIPEGKYFYINIQKKQRMIDLQENIENEKSREKKMKKVKKKENDVNVFNTSVINSILNRTNKEEMEIIFDINFENINNEDNIFVDKIKKLIDSINMFELKEDYYIDYNFESKKEKKNNKKEIISPLMNININYINFNKFNDIKTNSVSFNNQNNKNNNTFLYKIFNNSIKDSKRNLKNQIKNKNLHKEGASFLMKINQIKQNKKNLQNVTNYLKNCYNLSNKGLSISKNITSSMGKNTSSTNIKLEQKNKTIVYDYKNKNKEISSNPKMHNANISLKNIFTYRSSFGYLSPNNNKNFNNLELPQKFPLSSRNKNNDIERNNINIYLTNHKYFNNNNQHKSQQKNNKSTLAKNVNNLYLLINNSRNKIILNSKNKIIPGQMSSTKFLNASNSYTPLINKFKMKQKKKLRQNYSLLNNQFFKKDKFWNLENNNNNTLLKDNIILNNLVNEENNVDNKNINKNIFNNKTNYIKTKKMNHNNSSRNLNLEQINKRINNKRDMSGIYMNEFIRAFNNSKKLRNKFLSLKDNEK